MLNTKKVILVNMSARSYKPAADAQNPTDQTDMLYTPQGHHPPHSSVSPN